MKQREQALLLLLRKAAQDEALVDAVLSSDQVSDEIVGFHCQQAAEKILKALLSDLGVRFRKTHEIGALMALLAQAGHVLPDQFENLDVLTPFGAIYRYEDYDAVVSLDRHAACGSARVARLCGSQASGTHRPIATPPDSRSSAVGEGISEFHCWREVLAGFEKNSKNEHR
jgi:HEPN domain-containing protein